MSERPWQNDVGRQVRALRIIVAALVGGVLLFFLVVLVSSPFAAGKAEAERPVITWIALAFAGLSVVLRLVVPGAVVSSARRKILRGEYDPARRASGDRRQQLDAFFQRTGDAGRLMIVYMSTTILAAAILEWAAFFLLVAYMVERHIPGLVVAVALALAIAAHMPSRARVFAWIEGQLRRLDEARQFRRPSD